MEYSKSLIDSELFTGDEKILFLTLNRYSVYEEEFCLSDIQRRLDWSESRLKRSFNSLIKKGAIKNYDMSFSLMNYDCIWESKTLEELAKVTINPGVFDIIKKMEKQGLGPVEISEEALKKMRSEFNYKND